MAGRPRAQELMQLRAQLEAFQQANGGGARPDAPGQLGMALGLGWPVCGTCGDTLGKGPPVCGT